MNGIRRVAHAAGQERGGLLLLTPDEDRIVGICRCSYVQYIETYGDALAIIEIPYGFVEFVLKPPRPDTLSIMRNMGFPA